MPNRAVIRDEVLIALRRIVRAIDMHSKRLSQSYGVSGPQIVILKSLLATPDQAVGELARRVSLSQATVTDILDRLERRGLVQRLRSTTDKRRVLVRATESAVELLRNSPPLLQESFIARFDQLPDWEQTQLLSSLQRVAAMMDVHELDAAPMLSSGPIANGDEEP